MIWPGCLGKDGFRIGHDRLTMQTSHLTYTISTNIDCVPVTLPVQSEMLALLNDQEEIRMSEAENKMLINRMLAGEVDWLEQWASDAVWVIPGSTKWSGTYSGKTNIAGNQLTPRLS